MKKYILIFVSMFSFQHVMAAGFDCKAAKSTVEKMICSDDELSALDYRINYLYGLLSDVSDDKNKLKQHQLSWLYQRNNCVDTDCIIDAYEKQVDEYDLTLKGLISERKTPLREKFCVAEDLEATFGGGRVESLGTYYVDVDIEKSEKLAFVKFEVYFPDSGQILKVEESAKLLENGNITVRFTDGWNNQGVAKILRMANGIQLNLDVSEPAKSESSKNIIRQYGNFTLKNGACSKS